MWVTALQQGVRGPPPENVENYRWAYAHFSTELLSTTLFWNTIFVPRYEWQRKFFTLKTISSVIISFRPVILKADLLHVFVTHFQNTLARVVTGTRRRDHITPVLAGLHWLPVQARITVKVATMVYKIRETRQPKYLSKLITDYIPSCTLRSSSANRLEVHTCHSSTGARSFRHVAAAVWNGLPVDIRLSNSLETFRGHLKKYLFKLSYWV